MARGMMPRPPSNVGRSQPPRRTTQSRDAASGRITQRGPGADQIRQRQIEQQRRAAAAKAAAQQQRLRQQQFLREATGMRRRDEARRRTAELDEQVARLTGILEAGLARSARIDLDSLHQTADQPLFDPGALGTPAPEPVEADFARGRFAGRWGGQRRETTSEAYQRAHAEWESAERERKEKLADAERTHAALLAEKRAEADNYNSRIARIAAGLRDREPPAVESFVRTVLRRVPLPAGFPRRVEVRHDPYEEQVVVRMVLPGPDIVPEIGLYECEPPRFEVLPVHRPDEEIDAIYRLVLAQVALLVIRDVFEADSQLDSVSFEGLVDTVDPATGRPDLPCVICLEADRETFEGLDIEGLSPEDAVQELDALVTPDPYASQPA
jgi:restriction system protein